MPVLVGNIEKQIEGITEILNTKIVFYPRLQEVSDYLAGLLNQESLLRIEYFPLIEKLIKLFDKQDFIIPVELNGILGNVLMNFDHHFDNSEELTKTINNSLDILDMLGVDVF